MSVLARMAGAAAGACRGGRDRRTSEGGRGGALTAANGPRSI